VRLGALLMAALLSGCGLVDSDGRYQAVPVKGGQSVMILDTRTGTVRQCLVSNPPVCSSSSGEPVR
jgi:hypothetical protein